MARPYLNASVEELERLCSASLNDQARLRSILDELSHRSTTRALGLATLIRKRLGLAATETDLTAQTLSAPRPTTMRQAGEGAVAAPRPVVFGVRGGGESGSSPDDPAPEAGPALTLDGPSAASEAVLRPAPPAHPAVSSLSPAQRGVAQLIDYVRTLIELGAKPVWSLASYNNLVLHEDGLRDRVGIRHDLSDSDGPVYLKIDRLRRIDPPEPPPLAADWLAVGRDPFKAPAVEALRTAVMPIEEVERLIASGAVDRADVSPTLKPAPGKTLRDVVLRLERFPESKAAVEAFVAQSWAEWAESERPRRETIDIYERLFSLQQALKLEGSDRPLEVVWGMGVARWSLTPNELDHPIVEQLVELELDDAGAITVRPRGADPIVALKPFAAMENPGTDLVAKFAREHFAKLAPDRELSPFERDTFTPILRYSCAQFDRNGRFYPDGARSYDRQAPPAGPNLVITDTWALYARPRSENFFTADLDRLKEAVEAAASLPGPAVALVSEPSDEPTYRLSASLGAQLGGPSAGGLVGSVDDAREEADRPEAPQFFFPKPFNDEQVAIVDRLEQPDVEGVVVQGPPGTGKTHTIANIICHYLATGRRVLVTSKSEGALTVLRDQIPDGIRDLAISLLTSEREGLKQLEATVNILASKIASLDPTPTERAIFESEGRIGELRRRTDVIDAELRRFAEKHLRPFGGDANTDGILPIELAERVIRDRGRFGWFVDRPSFTASPQLVSEQDIAALRTARKALGPDLEYLGKTLPSRSDLPDATALVAIHQDLASAAKIESGRAIDSPVMSSTEDNALVRAETLLAAIEAIIEVHDSGDQAPWLANLYGLWRRQGLDAELSRPLTALVASLGECVANRAKMASYAVTTADDAQAHPNLAAAVDRAAVGQRPFPLLSLGSSDAKGQFAAVRILGRAPAAPEDWKRVAEVLEWRGNLAEGLARWRALAVEFNLPQLPSNPEEASRFLEPLLERVQAAVEAVDGHVPLVERETPRLFPHGLSPSDINSTGEPARRAADVVRTEVARRRLSGARAKLVGAQAALANCSGKIALALSEFISESVGDPNLAADQVSTAWTGLLAELDRLRSLRPQLETVARVAVSIAEAGAAAWARAVRGEPILGVDDPLTPSDWRDAWSWAQADAHLRAIDGRARLHELDDQRRAAEDETRRLFHEVVRLRTLLTLKARITRRVDAALQMFLTAIRRIGKGTGKSASRLRRDARAAMESSYAAVPCWIMPSWRISESLPSTLGSFDLVIIDEASQSDISALPALLRAKKVLIVGDDKQVSPTAAFIEERAIRSLRMHYLDGQPFGSLMLPGNSLYDLALASFPGRRIMLREHFRCVEPIIRFSFQFYTDDIVPVRVPKTSERLSPPLVDVHVVDGRKDKSNRNFAEAAAIVDEVARIVADPEMSGRSIGVVSLIGAKQAQLIQGMLLERIGEEAYLRHDVACGDSAVFQGKERDIMFLSMVECPATRTSKTTLTFQQRFNVALSRARDREYLYRSVSEDMLKPDDLKAKVLRHFKNPMEGRAKPAGDLMALCQSGFERDVLGRLLDLGYRVQPQVKVGPFSLDLVVEGRDDRRLAVELDGDQYHGPERWADDLGRQRTMERVGWRFWRCWGSSFRIDPEACMDDLVRTLTALGIEPIGSEDSSVVWTEFRTVSGGEDLRATATEAAAAQVQSPASTEGVQIGDRVQVQISGDTRVRLVRLTANRHDPDLGVISAQHPSGAALLGADEDDEIEFEIDGKTHRWMVVKIDRELTTA